MLAEDGLQGYALAAANVAEQLRISTRPSLRVL